MEQVIDIVIILLKPKYQESEKGILVKPFQLQLFRWPWCEKEKSSN